MDPLTVVTAAQSAETDELRTVLGQWVAAGLLSPFLWVEAGDTDRTTDARRTGVWLGEDGEAETGVLAKTGEHPYPLIRLVAVQLLHRDGVALTDGFPGADVEALLHGAMPSRMGFKRINLLVPATGVTDVSPQWLAPLWDANVVASPEDRISSAHIDQQVHHPGSLVAHAALAVATISGTWISVEEGPFDDQRIPQVGDRVQVVVVRSFARVIRAESMVEDITGQLLEGAPHSRINAAGAVPARDPARVAARLASEFPEVDDHAFRFRPHQPDPPPKQRLVGILVAFGMMFRYIWERLSRAPGDIVRRLEGRVRDGLMRWAQDATFGQDSGVAVRFGGRPGVRDQEEKELPTDAVRDARELAETILEQMEVPVTPPSAPRVWDAFRRVCLGLVDAGEFPEFLKPPSDGPKREAVADLHLVVPEPAVDRLQLKTVPFELRPCDPYQADVVRAWLTEQVAAAGEDEDAAADFVADLAVLEEWIERRSGSFAWRVGVGASEEFGKAARSFDQNLGIVGSGVQDPDDAAAARASKRLRRWWTALFVLFLVGMAFAAWRYLEVNPLPEVVAIAGSVFAVWVIGSLISFIQYQREMFRIEHRHQRSLHGYIVALQGAENDAREVARLSALYEQYRDWAEITGWLVHHPGGVLQGPGEPPEPAPPIAGPAALKVGTGEPSDQTLMAASSRVARRAFHAGWLQNLYGRYRGSSMSALKFVRGLDAEALDPDPDRDLAPPPPRWQILEDLEQSKFANEWRNELRGQVVGVLEEIDPVELFTHVVDEEDGEQTRSVDEFLGGLLPPDSVEEMLTPAIWTPQARQARKQAVHSCVLWGPESFERSEAVTAMVTLQQTRAHLSADRAFTLEAIRLDATDAALHEGLTLFALPDVAEETVQETPTFDPGVG